ncbi:gliding motility-associated C-terminal domain-containing protein [Flavobacterium phragmitis]|uniref:Gliding motility-associated C-terminal domain-containing protein n=2 Tax=Flavobacterium phragmitis TaxID=739143 RepID=A0A1I1T4E2_9FLAO|nr:gliding motility-associated C-terminal domain-containing protein [Flavobacterium phragmitis]
MENSMYKVYQFKSNIDVIKEKFFSCLGFSSILFCSVNSNAQFANQGDVKVKEGTILSVYMNYENTNSGNFINDGLVYIFEDWRNNGTVTFSPDKNGQTFFTGKKDQRIDGTKIADFQNLIFENYSGLIPFKLATTISVNNKTEFLNGIIDADTFNGKMIFQEDAFHTDASDLAFVDGQVQKNGYKEFEFPIGDELYFRPSYQDQADKTKNNNDSYTAQYFYKNSDAIHSHSSKDQTIKLINNKEYWNVTRDKGTNQIVLSLTLDSNTTPSEFFDHDDKTQVIMVRWDETAAKWVREGGEVSERMNKGSKGAGYTKLLMGKVNGYGMFTMALVDKEIPNDDLIVYNALSPNDDGINDTFLIKGIDKYPDNTVEIYNRWGVKVYEAKSYNESDVMFRGYSDGRATINRNDKLPTGTYFYIIKYTKEQRGMQKTGYLYINNQ